MNPPLLPGRTTVVEASLAGPKGGLTEPAAVAAALALMIAPAFGRLADRLARQAAARAFELVAAAAARVPPPLESSTSSSFSRLIVAARTAATDAAAAAEVACCRAVATIVTDASAACLLPVTPRAVPAVAYAAALLVDPGRRYPQGLAVPPTADARARSALSSFASLAPERMRLPGPATPARAAIPFRNWSSRASPARERFRPTTTAEATGSLSSSGRRTRDAARSSPPSSLSSSGSASSSF